MPVNAELFLKVAAAIEAEPERYDQSDWLYVEDSYKRPELCDTICCIAGHAVLQSGGKLRITAEKDNYDDIHYDVRFVDNNGLSINPEQHAQKALGITDQEAGLLFSGNLQVDGGYEPEAANVVVALRRIAAGEAISDVVTYF